ncbi:Uncharacterised protein [Mycobacteroides abscessus subsp. bolletii]|nr:Uncharacterised protein [Mycobacteroides abscessus subsp. abscessus]SKF71670.1 Uncharacterised protein [Mycobacteroides abscessus subsp. bolletii]SKF77225.1 Uncharacterised protein [Mycobacteroides abscessus subsp. bolletii]SKH79146.1 Uncharacterised protein [Mycobacteroides abscessus subsp. bolletii]SKK38458.1 Uncharacterised protein [Mycobacteroides abscessus subsp. bolletii]
MSGGRALRRACPAVLLWVLCLLVGGAYLLPGESAYGIDTVVQVSLYETDELHHWELSQPGAAVTRGRQNLDVQSAWLPVAISLLVLGYGAPLLAMTMLRRGAVLSRAPDNVGRQRLLYLGINRR